MQDRSKHNTWAPNWRLESYFDKFNVKGGAAALFCDSRVVVPFSGLHIPCQQYKTGDTITIHEECTNVLLMVCISDDILM